MSRIAINLKHINGTQEGVVQIFNQKIFSPPSTLDQLILEQLGNIFVESSVISKLNFLILINTFFEDRGCSGYSKGVDNNCEELEYFGLSPT